MVLGLGTWWAASSDIAIDIDRQLFDFTSCPRNASSASSLSAKIFRFSNLPIARLRIRPIFHDPSTPCFSQLPSWPLPRATLVVPQRPITVEGAEPYRLDGPVDSCHLIVGHRGTAPHSHCLLVKLEIHQVRGAHALTIVSAHASHCYESSEGGGEYNRASLSHLVLQSPNTWIYFQTLSPPSTPSSHNPLPRLEHAHSCIDI
jgi:hypothetical protein